MEKVVTMVWCRDSDDGDALRELLLGSLATSRPALDRLHASKVCVTDSTVARGGRLHLGPLRPDALVSCWVDEIEHLDPLERILDDVASRRAEYLVAETQPIRYAGPTTGRCDGFTSVGCLRRAVGLDHEDFRRRWLVDHRSVAIDTQSTFSYVRNEVVRPLTTDAPEWDAIVEEMFPLAALDDPHAFYDSGGDTVVLRDRQRAMVDSVTRFIDLASIDSHPMSEFRLG